MSKKQIVMVSIMVNVLELMLLQLVVKTPMEFMLPLLQVQVQIGLVILLEMCIAPDLLLRQIKNLRGKLTPYQI